MTTTTLINSDTYTSIAQVFLSLKELESWRGKIRTQEGFTKEDKEALNLMIFAIIKPIMLDEEEDISGLPAYVIKRLYKKAESWDSKPDNQKWFNKYIPDFDLQLEDYVSASMKACLPKEFADFLEEESSKLSDKVIRVYKAARVLGTLIEYEEMKSSFRPDVEESTRQEVYSSLMRFADLPHFNDIAYGIGGYDKLKLLLKTISGGRYTFRWQRYIVPVRSSILAHMLEAAVLSYLMNLEMGRDVDLVKDFWVLMFHDVSEIWTDDIPSPIKDKLVIFNPCKELLDSLFEGKEALTFKSRSLESVTIEERKRDSTDFSNLGIPFRDVVELQERDALEQNFYAYLPDEEMVSFFREGVMLEDVDDAEQKSFYKSADYFAADLEVWWNIKGGSREQAFGNILNRSLTKNRTSEQKEFLKDLNVKCRDIVFFD